MKDKLNQKRELLTYMVIGTGSTLFDFMVFNVIYIMSGIGALSFFIANAIAFIATNTIRYLMNSHFTFPTHRLSLGKGLKFILVSSGTFLLFNSLLYLVFNIFPGICSLSMVNGIKLILGVVNGGTNYIITRVLVFT